MSEDGEKVVSLAAFRQKREREAPIDDKKLYTIEAKTDDLNDVRLLLVYKQGLVDSDDEQVKDLIKRLVEVLPEELLVYGSSPFNRDDRNVPFLMSYNDFRIMTRAVKWFPSGEEMIQKYNVSKGEEFNLDQDRLRFESAYLKLSESFFKEMLIVNE